MDANGAFSKEDISLLVRGDFVKPIRVIQYDDINERTVLRTVCREVDLGNHYLSHLITRLFYTVTSEEYKGVGIAAPQIGINLRVFLVQRHDKDGLPFEYFINPEILWYSKLKLKGEEGCLSMKDVSGVVYRSQTILISYYDIEGVLHKEVIEGFTAVIVQHEYDHLSGVLFTDRSEEQLRVSYVDASSVDSLFYVKE